MSTNCLCVYYAFTLTTPFIGNLFQIKLAFFVCACWAKLYN